MKLEENYLRGAIDMVIDSYQEGFRLIPKETGLEYSIEYGNSAGKTTSAKIKFKWVEYGETKMIDEDANSGETEQRDIDDYFTIVDGEDLGKLREYVEEILEKIAVC